jgi:predicted urease superfamily metal-dependent hydrolase
MKIFISHTPPPLSHTCSSFPCSSGRLFQKKHDFVKIKLIDSKKIILQVETEPSPLVGLHPTECVFFFFKKKKKKKQEKRMEERGGGEF